MKKIKWIFFDIGSTLVDESCNGGGNLIKIYI